MGFRWRVPVFVAVLALLGAALTVGSGVAVPTASTTAPAASGAGTLADPPPERWNRTYGGTDGRFTDVEVTPNGTVFAVGSRLAADGSELDGWLVAGSTNGTERWNRTYGGSEDDVVNDVLPTDDGGALLVGTSVSHGPGAEDGWALKVDRQGDVEWRIATGGPDDDEFAAVERTPDGYLIAGTYADGSDTDGWLVKVASDGTLAWTNRYDVRVSDSLAAIDRRPTGGYVLAGETASVSDPRPNGLVLTVDGDGTKRRQYLFGRSASDRFRAVEATPDGGLLLAGATRSFGSDGEQGWVVRLDADGTERWRRVPETGPLADVEPTPDGSFLLAGQTRSASGFGDAVLVALGADGEMAWSRTYGGPSYESFTSVDSTPDGGYLLAGESGTDRGWPGTGWLVKLGGPEPATPLVPPGVPADDGSTPGEPTTTRPTTTTTETPEAAAPPASESEGRDEMSPVSVFIVVAVVSIFLAGFLFLLWDLADDPLGALNRRTPLVDLTVVFNRFDLGDDANAGPDPAGAGPNFDGRADAGSGPGGFGGGRESTTGTTDEAAGFGGAGGSTTDPAGGGFGGAGGTATDQTDEPIDVGGGASTARAGSAEGASADETAGPAGGTDAGAGPESATEDGEWEYPGAESIAESVAESTDIVVAGGPDDESSVPATRAPVPGTFTLHNGGSRALICRFRCHTTDEVVFDYWVEIGAGATRRAHATPTDAPFEILVNVEDDLLASRVFVNNDRGGANVTATVSEEAIDITLTEDLAESPLADADDHESPTDDDALAGVGGESPAVDDDAPSDGDDGESVEHARGDAGAEDSAESGDGDDPLAGDDGWTPDVEVAEPEAVDDVPADDGSDDAAADTAEGQPAEPDGATLDDAETVMPDESPPAEGNTGTTTAEGTDDAWTPDVDVAEPDQDDGGDATAAESDGEDATEAVPDDGADADQADTAGERTGDTDAVGPDEFATAWTNDVDESAGNSDPWSGGIDSSQAGDIDSSQVVGPAESEPADEGPRPDTDATGGDAWTEAADGIDDTTDEGVETEDTPDDDPDDWSVDAADASGDDWTEDVDIDTGGSEDEASWTDDVDMAGIGSSWDDDEATDATEDWTVDDPESSDLDDDWAGDLRTPDDEDDEDDGDDGDE